MRGNGLMLPGQQQPAKGPVFNVGPLMGDVQLLAMMAGTIAGGNRHLDAKACAERASDVLFETLVEYEQFTNRVDAWRKDQAKAAVGAAD